MYKVGKKDENKIQQMNLIEMRILKFKEKVVKKMESCHDIVKGKIKKKLRKMKKTLRKVYQR